MRFGDIVVAVDGMRVQNLAQYYAVKTASLDPVMRVIVWRDLKYVEVTAPLRYGGVWGVVRPYPAPRSFNPTAPLHTRRW